MKSSQTIFIQGINSFNKLSQRVSQVPMPVDKKSIQTGPKKQIGSYSEHGQKC